MRLHRTPELALRLNHQGMKILNLLHVTVACAFYRWALREIDPLHPDVPRLLLRRQELEERAHRLWAV